MTAGLVALAAMCACAAPAPVPPVDSTSETPRPLPSSLREALKPGDAHRFRIDLAAGDLLDVRVEQQGVDLELRVLDADGSELLLVDGPYGERGTERALFVATAAGPIDVELRAAATATEGSYELQSSHRSATDSDRPLLEAAQAHAAGDRARRSKNWDPAADAYVRAAALWRRAGDGKGETTALHRLGQVRREQADPAALNAYLDARQAARTAGFRVAEADLTYGIGQLHLNASDLDAAVEAFQEAAGLYGELSDHRRQALAVNETAGARERQGDLDGARQSYGLALELARGLDDPRWQGIFLTNLGWVYLRLGQSELALDVFTEALDLRRRAGDQRGKGIVLTNRGIAERRLGRFEEARDSFVAAWRILAAEEDPPRVANALMGLGWTELELGRLDRAERAFNSALKLLRPSGRQRPMGLVLLDLAEVRLARGDGDGARALADEALALFDALADRHGQASACFALARAERLRGHLETAYGFHALALERIESVRERARVDLLRTSYLAFRREYYEQAVDVAMELHRHEPEAPWTKRAVETSERGRARELLETLLFVHADLPRRLDAAVREREDHVANRLIDLELQRLRLELSGSGAEALAAVRRDIRRASLELAEIRSALRAGDPAAADLLSPAPFDVKRFMERQLDPDTVVIEISLGATRGHLFWIDHDSVTGFPIPGRDRLDPLARLAHQSLQDSHKPLAAGQARRALRDLSREVLGPVADRLDAQRLAIVADGALHYVPFGVLPDPRYLDDEAPPPLLERHEVVSPPSAAVLEVLRRPRSGPTPSKTLAVLADPVFGPDDPRLNGRSGPSTPGREPPERLPFTADEAAAIRSLVPDDDSFVALSFDANVELLQSGALAHYRILHMATHGRLNSEQPELSGLELSRYYPSGRPRRGTLYAHQIYDLPLNADLVVLSACRTALGREIRGEGLIGLTRGFFQAGASRVVVSLWSVDDRATTELMIRFYRHLLASAQPPAAALRAAQLELRAEPRWAAPYFWAGFVVQGDWR